MVVFLHIFHFFLFIYCDRYSFQTIHKPLQIENIITNISLRMLFYKLKNVSALLEKVEMLSLRGLKTYSNKYIQKGKLIR